MGVDGLGDPEEQFSRSEVKKSKTYAKVDVYIHSFVTSPLVSVSGHLHVQAVLSRSKNPPFRTDSLLTVRTGVGGHFGEEMKRLFCRQSNHVILVPSTQSTDLTLLFICAGAET